MKKHIALSLSFLLVAMSMMPAAYAEEAADATSAAEVKAETANESPATTEAPAVEVKSDQNTEKPAPTAAAVSVKTASDYKDLKVLSQEQMDTFNFFIDKGTFIPESEDTFGINSLITRDEFVKASQAIFSSTDEALTNPPYFENYVKLGLLDMDGKVVDGSENVSRQDMAKFLIYGLDKVADARKVTPTTDLSYNDEDGVSVASAGFVTLALQLKIVQNQEDGHYGGDRQATRRMLADAAYATKKFYEEMNDTSKVSIGEVKAVGAKKVSVTFNKILDTSKTEQAVLTIKKDGSVLEGKISWSADNKTATVTLDQKLKKGNYTVELSGLDEAAMDKRTAEFSAEDEQIKGIEFVNTSDILARSKVIIDFKQTNQYGEQTDSAAHRFEITAGSRLSPQNIVGQQAFRLDLSDEKRGARIAISLFDREHNLSANKVFTVGDRGIVSKIELGDLKYKDNRPYLKPGNKAYLSFFAYDQYGNRIDDPEELNKGIVKFYDGEQIFEDTDDNTYFDYDEDGYDDLELVAIPDIKKDTGSTLKLMAVGSGQTVSKKISVLAPKIAASVEIKDLTHVLAEGDKDATIELIVRDAEGYEFSQDERKELFEQGDIKVSSNGRLKLGTNITGNITIDEVTGTGAASVEVSLEDADKTATAEYTLMPKREPQLLEKSNFDPAFVYTVPQSTAVSPAFIIKDQYDEEYSIANPEYQVQYKLERTDGDAGAFTAIYDPNKAKVALNDAKPIIRVSASDAYNKSVKLTADAKKLGSYQMTATLLKVKQDPNQTDITKWPIVTDLNSITARAESYTMKELDEDLKYTIDSPKSLFAAGKYLVKQGLGQSKDKDNKEATQGDAISIFNTRDPLTTSISVRAFNKDGVETNTTGVSIASMQIADPKIMAVNKTLSPTKIVGLNPGSTTAIFTINTPAGQKVIQDSFTVYESDVTIGALSTVKLGKSGNAQNVAANDINGNYIWYSSLLSKITVTDSDSNSFVNQASLSNGVLKNTEGLTPFMGSLLTEFTLSDITYQSGTKEENKDTFYMTNDYKLVFEPKSGSYSISKVNLKSFKLTVKAGSKSAYIIFTLK